MVNHNEIMSKKTENITNQLQAALEVAVQSSDTSFPGAVLHVRSPGFGSWSGGAGLGEIETETPIQPNARFRAGSVLKSIVAVVVLQLVEEGPFSLDDPMTAVLPDDITSRFAASDKITLRMLLNHTSGIPDWLTEAASMEIGANPTRIWTLDEYLQIATEQESYFPPGEGFTYSNTDYNLLEVVIEQVTGRSWREEIRTRIVEPLHLEDTLLPEPGDLSIPSNYAHGYLDIDGTLVDYSRIDSSMAGAAGGHALVTTTMDLAQFLEAMLSGELFTKIGTLDEVLNFVDISQDARQDSLVGYGLGIMKFMLPGDIEMIGHAGTTGGYQCFVYNLPAQAITISGMMNHITSSQMQLISPALELLVPGFSL